MGSCKMRDVKTGEAIMYNKEIWVVFDRHEQTRGNLRTYWQVKLKNLERGNVFEQRFSPDDAVEKIILNREEHEFLYQDGDMLVFMHPDNFEQISAPKSLVPEAQQTFLIPNLRLNLLKLDQKVLQIELPQTVEVQVSDAPESARGDTATAVFKLATIETGGEVKVPGHIKKGDRIKVRVEDGEFLGRVN